MRDEKDQYDDTLEQEDDEFSMESYFKKGLAENKEPNNPFEPDSPKKKKKTSLKKKGESPFAVLKKNFKKICIIAAIILAVVIGIIIAVTYSKRKNDGAKFARTLSDSIGLTLASAQQTSGYKLEPDSAYPAVNSIYYMYNAKMESKKAVTLDGCKFPQWLIVCDKDGDNLAGVKFFDFRTLSDSIYGEKRKSFLDPKTVQPGSTIEQVESALELEPYCTQYLRDKTQQRDYRYYYKDGDTGDIATYTISALFNTKDELTDISVSRANYLSGILLNGIK